MAVPAASGRRGLTRPESHRDASRVLTAAPADNIFCQHLPPRNLVIGSSVQCELNNTTTLTGPNRTRSIIQLQRLVSQYRCVFTHAISKKPQAHTQHTQTYPQVHTKQFLAKRVPESGVDVCLGHLDVPCQQRLFPRNTCCSQYLGGGAARACYRRGGSEHKTTLRNNDGVVSSGRGAWERGTAGQNGQTRWS